MEIRLQEPHKEKERDKRGIILECHLICINHYYSSFFLLLLQSHLFFIVLFSLLGQVHERINE